MEETLFCGDCLVETKKLKVSSIDLVYLDPPFFSQQVQRQKDRSNKREFAFSDKWENVNGYCQFMRERLIECHRVLKKQAAYFFTVTHPLRIIF